MSLKFTGELCVMTMKNDAKIEEEITTVQNWHEEFDEFWHFTGLPLTDVYNAWA